MDTKLCIKCGNHKPLDQLESFEKNGKTYYRSRCTECGGKRYKRYRRANIAEVRRRERESIRRQRAAGENLVRWIYADSRKSDRKKGRLNDLTRDFIEAVLAKGKCTYCHNRKLRLTLDRIDNSLGHLQSNVVVACIRCNYVRGAVPYKAWLELVPGIRRAVKKGLFGDWTGRAR